MTTRPVESAHSLLPDPGSRTLNVRRTTLDARFWKLNWNPFTPWVDAT